MNLIEQLNDLCNEYEGGALALSVVTDLRSIIEQHKSESVEPVAIDSGYIEGTAERLRLICSKLGIGAPESNEELMLCQFSLFGLIRGKIDAIYKTQPDHTKLIGELVEALEGLYKFASAKSTKVDALLTKAREAIK